MIENIFGGYLLGVSHVQFANLEGVGFMIYTAASH